MPDDKTTAAVGWPDGWTQLGTEEAREALLFQDHKDAAQASMKTDSVVLKLLEVGSLVVAKNDATGEIAFQASKAAVEGTDDVGKQRRGDAES